MNKSTNAPLMRHAKNAPLRPHVGIYVLSAKTMDTKRPLQFPESGFFKILAPLTGIYFQVTS